MARRSVLHWVLLTALLVGTHLRLIGAQSQKGDGPLTVEEVVKLSQIGVSEELIVAKIKKNGKAFDLSTEELVDLKKAGVSDIVIKFLLDPSQPYTPPSAPGSITITASYPGDTTHAAGSATANLTVA